MTIEIVLDAETEARLTAEAALHGIPKEKYAGRLLQDSLIAIPRGTGKLTGEEMRALGRRLSADSKNLPVLPEAVNDRESYYEDRA